jgi:hypothetical protein
MPQRASNTKWNGSSDASFNGFAAFPELTARAALIINGWSTIEAHLGRVFGTLIGAKQPATMSMYSAVRSAEVQRDIFKAACTELLPIRYAKLAHACLDVIHRASGTRNRLAHWIWSVSTDPAIEALLLVEPRHLWKVHARQIRHIKNERLRRRIGAAEFWNRMPVVAADEIWMYTVTDLKREVEAIEYAGRIADGLRLLVDSDVLRRRTIYRWLNAEPDLQKALRDIQKKRSKPKTQSRLEQRGKAGQTKRPKPGS